MVFDNDKIYIQYKDALLRKNPINLKINKHVLNKNYQMN